MIRLLRSLFEKPAPPPPPGSLAEFHWEPDLADAGSAGFQLGGDGRYEARSSGDGLALELHRPSLFAWSQSEAYTFADAVVCARFSLPETGAAGLVLRMASDLSFYCLSISREGAARMDLLFNGEPRALVPWVPCPWLAGKREIVLDLVMRGSRFIALANGRWAFEIDDEALAEGRIGFAARSGESGGASATLRLLVVDSRPMEAELEYARLGRALRKDPNQRRRLAEALYAEGSYVPAAVQYKAVAEGGQARADDYLAKARCSIGLGLLDDAIAELDRCLGLEPSHAEARRERFNALYLAGRFAELRDGLAAGVGPADPMLHNLLGHAHYNLGAWGQAALAYALAAEGDPSTPLYRKNEARALEREGRKAEAAAAWLAAARGFFTAGGWDDASICSMRLRELRYDARALDSLDARIAYGRGELKEAEAAFAKLAKKKALDAPCAYLYGRMKAAGGDADGALALYRTAAAAEPETAIYRFRLAEALYLNGDPGYRTELDAALSLAPEDGWILNLAGLAELGRDDEAAEGYFRRAAAAIAGEPEPLVNLAEAMMRRGRAADAAELLRGAAEARPEAANQLGNALAALGRLAEAAEAYGRAAALSAGRRGSPEATASYLGNRGAALIEAGELSAAEGALRKALELSPADPRATMLMGDLAIELGDYVRGELAYRVALERTPGDRALILRLARSLKARGRYAEARAAAETLPPDPERDAVIAQIEAASRETMSCDGCGREWGCPRPLPPVPKSALRGEPPDESPAGACPSCGAVFCVGCAKHTLTEGRLLCPRCGARLKLEDDRLRFVARSFMAARP